MYNRITETLFNGDAWDGDILFVRAGVAPTLSTEGDQVRRLLQFTPTGINREYNALRMLALMVTYNYCLPEHVAVDPRRVQLANYKADGVSLEDHAHFLEILSKSGSGQELLTRYGLLADFRDESRDPNERVAMVGHALLLDGGFYDEG